MLPSNPHNSNGILTRQDNGELLKKALLQFPRRYQHHFSKAVKVDLRRVLFFAASTRGKYMEHLFEDVDANTLPKIWPHVLLPERYQHLEGQDFYFQRAHIHDPSHPNRSCGRKFKKGEPIYRCVTCSCDDSSALCLECFVEENHKGHDVIPLICHRENGGVCDCGDDDAWQREFKCAKSEVQETPLSEIPQDFRESLSQTFEIALDFVVDVMAGSTPILNYTKPVDAESVLVNSHQSTFEQGKYCGTDWPSEEFCLMMYNDQNRQYGDAIQKITSTTGKVIDFAYMVADEVNRTGRAKLMCHSDLEELIVARNDLANAGLPCCIRNARDVFREEMCSEIILWLLEMTNGTVFGNYNVARDLVTRAFCRKWDVGVKPRLSEEIGGGHLSFNNIPSEYEPFSQDFTGENHSASLSWNLPHKRWNVDQSIAEDCDYDPNFNMSMLSTFYGSRLQYLLFFDIRFWKAARTNLHNLVNSVLTSNQTYRPIVCCQYVDIYPKLLEMFFHHDREPEYSCMTSLTTQVFTSSSNATLIAQHGDLTRLLAASYGYLTTLHLMCPEGIRLSNSLLLPAFKNRRIGQVFFDVCCVLTKSSSLNNVINQAFIAQVCDILVLFQGKPTLKREALEHVEYESSDYGLYFNMYSVVASLSEMVAKVFLRITPAETRPLIALIFDRIVQSGAEHDLGSLEDITDVTSRTSKVMTTIQGPFLVDDFKPHKGDVSFLHPLHAFVTWALQYSQTDNIEEMGGILQMFGNEVLFVLLEYPLRTLVILSQIRIGMWVRNGYSIRTQQHIYRSSGIRESGFKRDVYFIQMLMCFLPPDQIMASFINKWSLEPWLLEDFTNSDDYDKATLPLIVEEFLLIMIQLLGETSYLFDSTKLVENRIKRELIHSLCFEPMSYSKLCSSIPDYMSHEKRFDLILKEISIYTPPNGPNGTGIYSLKDKYFDEVDPYYIHYSSNKREEAEKLMKARVAKLNRIPFEDAYIKPKLQSLEGTLFEKLFAVTSSRILLQFLRSTLKYVNTEGPDCGDTLPGLSLHLIHMGVEGLDLSHSTEFNTAIWSELTADHNEPFYYESVGALLYKFLSDESLSAHHSKIRAIFRSLNSNNVGVEDYLQEQVEHFDPSLLRTGAVPLTGCESEFDKKKRLAKDRRAKLMAKFKKQQTQFVEKNKSSDQLSDTDMAESDPNEGWSYPEEHCILCQMSLNTEGFFGVVCNVAQSSVNRSVPFQDHFWTMRAFEDVEAMDAAGELEQGSTVKKYFSDVQAKFVIGPPYPANEPGCLKTNLMANSCGHGMHYGCYQQYLASAKSRQTQITRTVPEDFENAEFICPLCKSLGNMFLPILWSKNTHKLRDFVKAEESWFDGLESARNISCSEPSCIAKFTDHIVEDVQKSMKPSYNSLVFTQSGIPQALHEIFTNLTLKIESASQPHFKDHLTRVVYDTVKSTEIALRGLSCPSGLVTDLVSNQSLTTLRILVELRKTMLASTAFIEQKYGKREGFPVKVAEERLGKFAFLSSDRLFDVFEDIDFFDFLVSCSPYGNVTQNTLYRMGFMCVIIQRISSLLAQLRDGHFDSESVGLQDITLVKSTSPHAVANMMTMVRQLRDNHPLFDNISDEIFEGEDFPYVFYTTLVRSITPFLRHVAIYAISNCADYSGIPNNSSIDDGLECNRLSTFLHLPTLDELLSLFNTTGTVEKVKFDSFVKYVSNTDNDLRFASLAYPGVIRLIDLPTKLHDIFTQLIYKDSPSLSLTTFDPAICLFCAKILNLQNKSAGHPEGECNHHTEKECLNHVGIFLLPRHSAILLLNKGNGSFHPAPYIDAHGEFDSEVRQSQIMTLSKAKYDHFTRQMWIQQDTKNYITRKLEGTLDIGGWESL